ncbi:amidohydrolase [Terrilactibacillus sp. BCM23-1]|uniref:Amidohydrolase n=1 Tax=Terrilactibacillus tamarindi TaxID=2599694 RepID=A0A6N8CN71_9BACI|nr:M20 family metallopeptidase [Terrilactibacillus tamarindi]MTT31010.1 amidohydrolase [Terrilactibacillus tamarindi]
METSQAYLSKFLELHNDEWIAFRRDLHAHPELSEQEKETSEKVAQALTKLGIPFKKNIGGYGIIAEITGSEPGPTIALRADMDALPIKEETNLPFKSVNDGVMHACGHDIHTTILLATAQTLSEHTSQFKGTVRFIFQPAEEVNVGAIAMIKEGVLDNVQEIYGLHNAPTLPVGSIGIKPGPLMGSVDRIELTIEGKGGHGAAPEASIDPIVAGSSIVMGIQTAISREISPIEPAVITIGSFHAGLANNIIPSEAKLTGTIRTFSPKVQEQIKQILPRIIEQQALSYRCTAHFNYIDQSPAVINSERQTDYVKKAAEKCLGADHVTLCEPTTIGEDFANYLKDVPGAFFWLGSGPETNAEKSFGLHHPKCSPSEGAIKVGVDVLSHLIFDRLG